MKMFKLTRPLDERGVSIVLGAILLLGIGIAVGSLVYSQYVQSSIHSSEASHMEEVKTNFIQLQTEVASMKTGGTTSVGIPMSASYPFFVPTRGQIGSLSLEGSIYSPGGNIQIGPTGKGYIYGEQATTKSIGGDYLTINEAIFQERFFDASNWIMMVENDDLSTSSPGLNSGMTHTQDGSNSVYVSVSAQRTESKVENAYWVVKNGINVPGNGNDNVSLSAWLNSSINPNIHPDPSAPFDEAMKIDYQKPTLIQVSTYVSSENVYQGGTDSLTKAQQANKQYENIFENFVQLYSIAYDAVGSGSTGSSASGSFTWNHTTGSGSNRIMIVGISIKTPTVSVSSVTYDAENLTFIRADNTSNIRSELWYLIAPASGTATVTVTLSGSSKAVGGSVTYANVDQTSPIDVNGGGSGTSTLPTQSVTISIENCWLVGNLAVSDTGATVTDNIGQNVRWDVKTSGGSPNIGHGSDKGSVLTGSQTMSWTLKNSADWSVSVVAIKPVSGYIENVQHNITSIPVGQATYSLKVGYYTAGDVGFSAYLHNFTTSNWENVGILQGGSSDNQNTFIHSIDNQHISGGNVEVRYVQSNADNIQSSLMVDYTVVISTPPSSIWNNAITFEDNNPDSFSWIRFVENSPLTKNQIRNIENLAYIRVYLKDLASAGSSAFAQVGASLSMDEISLLDGPPFDIDVTIKSATISNPDNVENIVENIGFWSIGSSAYFTLQIENFAKDPSDPWENLQSGYVGGTEVFWGNVLNNPRNYIDNISGTIMFRLIGHNDNLPFDLALDWVDLEAVYPSSYIEYYSPNFTRNGRVEFDMLNYSYPNQTYIYEDGAVILYQKVENSSVMVSEPLFPLAVAIPRDNENIEVDINTILVDKSNISDNSVVKAGWSTISVQAVDNYYRVPLSRTPNTAVVEIDIDNSPLTSNAWYDYLNKLAINLNAQGANAYVQSGEDKFSLIIQGKVEDPLVNDIYYSEKIQEIVVGIA
jgi:hypothetical protein